MGEIFKELRCLTWNVNGVDLSVEVNKQRVLSVLNQSGVLEGPIGVIALQEVISPSEIMFGDVQTHVNAWNTLIQSLITESEKQILCSHSQTGVCTCVIYDKKQFEVEEKPPILHKGGVKIAGWNVRTKATVCVVVSRKGDEKQVALLNSHLPAYHYLLGLFKQRDNTDAADQDRAEAASEAEEQIEVLQKHLRVAESVVWMGDFNSRMHRSMRSRNQVVSVSNDPNQYPLEEGDSEPTFDGTRDSLKKLMKHPITSKCVFEGYREEEIKFGPTFKIPLNASQGSMPGKHWTDRIIYKGNWTRELEYDRITTGGKHSVFEDHWPVYLRPKQGTQTTSPACIHCGARVK